MWDFLKVVLERYGLAAAVLLIVLVAAGWGMRELWKRVNEANDNIAKNVTEAQKKVSEAQQAATEEVANMKEAHAREMAAVKEAHAREIALLQQRWRESNVDQQQRLDALQERRVVETQEFTREAVNHIAATREEVSKMGRAMQTLIDVMAGSRRG